MGALSQVVNAAVLAALIALAGTFFKSWSEQSQANRKPFLSKQLELCFEASDAAGRLATEPDSVEWEKARREFWRLYWGTLSIVEDPDVETAMVTLGKLVPKEPVNDSKPPPKGQFEVPSYQLAHAVRDLLLKSWNIDLPPLKDKRTQ